MMLLENKTSVIYGGGGQIGGAVARTFAREGATVYLAGRTQAKLDVVAESITAAGGTAHSAVVDTQDAAEVTAHADSVAADGPIDILLDATGYAHVQGVPIAELTLDEYELPLRSYTRSNFNTAKAVSAHMAERGSGVVLTLSTPGSQFSIPGILGNAAASAAVEGFSRALAGELGGFGVRVICLRPHMMRETAAESHVGPMFQHAADLGGITLDELFEGREATTLLGRLPALQDVADYAAFVASDRAGSMTSAIANLTSGALWDT
jgi:NAD(P)-dependent dehydrogenase (short-subunit alcohol dehydrogenase family)